MFCFFVLSRKGQLENGDDEMEDGDVDPKNKDRRKNAK